MTTLAVPHEAAEGLPPGVFGFTTTRQAGSFGLAGNEPVAEVLARWSGLRGALAPAAVRIASSTQVHGAAVLAYDCEWSGWLRGDAADGHFSTARGLALAVSVADCTPVFLAHPSGAVAVLHAGWRGTAARIIDAGVAQFAARGMEPRDLAAHLGPAICGTCYEVGPEVHLALTGRHVIEPAPADVRAILADQLEAAGVRRVSISKSCTLCDNDRFFSHRAGDAGRQLGVIVALAGS